MSLFVAAFTLTACGGDDDNNNSNSNSNTGNNETPAVVNDLIGTWSYRGTSMIFTNDKITAKMDGQVIVEGSYTIKDGKLTMVVKQGGSEDVTKVATVKLLYDKSILVLKYVAVDAQNSPLDVAVDIFFKEGKKAVTPVSDIQGTWHTYANGQADDVFAGVKVNGNNVEVILTMWSQRHVGTFTYNAGVMNLKMTQWWSGRGEHGHGSGPGNINPATHECDHWIACDEEDFADQLDKELVFVADGNEAYGYIVGKPSVFVKK